MKLNSDKIIGSCFSSPPARGRGLKLRFHLLLYLGQFVAPRAGAWIETATHLASIAITQSPPARGRGLKLDRAWLSENSIQSPPARGRGLKLR